MTNSAWDSFIQFSLTTYEGGCSESLSMNKRMDEWMGE